MKTNVLVAFAVTRCVQLQGDSDEAYISRQGFPEDGRTSGRRKIAVEACVIVNAEEKIVITKVTNSSILYLDNN